MATKPIAKLREAALGLPEAEEGVSGNKACFRAGKKNFLFIGDYGDSWDVMLKLGDSIGEAEKLSKEDPDRYGIGRAGWVSANFAAGDGPPSGLFERWIEESYRLIVPKRLVSLLPEPE